MAYFLCTDQSHRLRPFCPIEPHCYCISIYHSVGPWRTSHFASQSLCIAVVPYCHDGMQRGLAMLYMSNKQIVSNQLVYTQVAATTYRFWMIRLLVYAMRNIKTATCCGYCADCFLGWRIFPRWLSVYTKPWTGYSMQWMKTRKLGSIQEKLLLAMIATLMTVIEMLWSR